ncbi:MAG: LysR family transcriptional regulator [Myxococcota bacterium]
MNTPLDLDQYVAIVEAGSISEAARLTGEPRATLSRRLTRLEEQLGVRLAHRSTRHLEPTRAGLELYHRARHIVDEVHAAEQALRRLDDVPRGPLRVSVPNGPMLAPLFAAFLGEHPGVLPDIVATDRHVDLVREGFDVAIRAGRATDPSLVRRVIAHARVVAVGSPAYLAARGVPRTLADLGEHACIVGYGGGERMVPVWPLLDGGEVRVPGRIGCNELGIAIALAVAGHGLTVAPDALVAGPLAAGQLQLVLPELVGSTSTLALVYPERRLLEPAVRAFVDFTAGWFERNAEVLREPSVGAC